MIGACLSRAASREATTVDEEVTFYTSIAVVDGNTMAGIAN